MSALGTTILLVEDDQDVCEAVADVLTDEGYRVVTAAHGAEGLEQLRAGLQPDVILLDIMMPVMDGWAFRAAQLADPAFACIPVIVMSAQVSAQEVRERLDAAGFLKKPVRLDALLEMLVNVCGRERARPPGTSSGG